MNRYDVFNQREGSQFLVQGTSFPPAGYQPAWGQRARTKRLSACDNFELPRATNQRPDPSDPQGVEQLVDLPDDFTVTTTSLDAQIAADQAAATARAARLTRLKNFDPSAASNGLPELKAALKDLFDHVLGK